MDKDIPEKIIHISTKQNSKEVVIEIKDTAGEIKNKDLDKIFEPHLTVKHNKNATGFGLYMSKMILEDNLRAKLVVDVKNNITVFSIIIPKK